jgi:hypothetical protein
LDLFSRRMLDLDGGAALDTGTRLAVRAQTPGPKAPSEARIAETEPKRADLVIERAGPDVWILLQALCQIRHERFEGIGFSATPFTSDSLSVQVIADRPAVPAEMPGDRRDRPALFA